MNPMNWKSGVVLVALLSATACGSATTSGSGGTAPSAAAKPHASAVAAPVGTQPKAAPKHLTHVTLQLGWLATATEIPFAYAESQGYYRDAGLALRIVEGRSTTTTAQLVAKGGPMFGEGSASNFFLAVGRGVPIKVVTTYLHKSPTAFIYHKSAGFTGPKDLLGRTIITAQGAPPWELLPAILSHYGVKRSQLHPQFVSPRLEHTLFMKDPKSIHIAYIYGATGVKEITQPSIGYQLYADDGLNLYDAGIIASDSMISRHPALVRAFLMASAKGWKAVLTDPSAAKAGIAALVKQFPNVKPADLAKAWAIQSKLLDTPATRGKPIGWMSPAEVKVQLAALHKYVKMQLKPASDYYTNRFAQGAPVA